MLVKDAGGTRAQTAQNPLRPQELKKIRTMPLRGLDQEQLVTVDQDIALALEQEQCPVLNEGALLSNRNNVLF